VARIAFISSVFRGAAANSEVQDRIVPPLAPCLSRCSYSMVDRMYRGCRVVRPQDSPLKAQDPQGRFLARIAERSIVSIARECARLRAPAKCASILKLETHPFAIYPHCWVPLLPPSLLDGHFNFESPWERVSAFLRRQTQNSARNCAHVRRWEFFAVLSLSLSLSLSLAIFPPSGTIKHASINGKQA